MVDEVTGLSILGSRHKDIKAVDSEYAVIPEMKGTGGTNTGLVAPTQDHVITPVIGGIKPQGIDDESVIEDSPSVLTTIKAAVAPTARDWGNGFYEKYTFERDLDYTEDQAKEDVDEFQRLYGVATAEEVRYMSADTKSAAHMQHKWERVLDKREDTKALIANPITGIVSSVLDLDVVAAFTPVGVVGGVTKAARMGQRAIRGAVGAGVAGGINTVLDEQSLRTDFEQNMDIVSFGLIGALASTSRAIPKAGTTLDNQIDSELRTLSQGGGTPVNVYGTEVRINPNAPMVGKDLVPDSLKSTKVGAAVDSAIKSTSAVLSSGERMFKYIGYDINHPAARLLASSRTQGDNATYAAATHQANLDHRLMGLGDDIKDVTREVYGTNPILGYAEHTKRMVDVQIEYIRHTQKLDSDVLKFQDFNNRLPTAQELDDFITASTAPDYIKRLQRTYIKSGFAEEAYDLISHAKLLDDDTMEKITRRSTYTPVRHSYQNMRNLINSKRVQADELYNFIGRQIQRMYPELMTHQMKYNLSAHALGKNFYDAKQLADNATAAITTGGFTKESLTLLMRKSGMNEDTAYKVVDDIFRNRDATVSAGGQQGSLRARLNWDWDDTFEGLDGLRYSMADLVDHDIFKTLKDYSRTTSHRIGLAKYGVKSQNDLEKIMQDLVENRPDGVSLQAARQYAIGVRQQLLGQPIGEALNPVTRSMQSVGGSLVLGGSGLWAVNDLITQTYKVGLLRSLPHIVKSLGTAFKSLKGMSKTDLDDFYEILRGRLGTASGWEHIMTRYDDAFDVSKNIHGTIAHHGQSTRFANGSEFVRRLQVNLLAGIFESAFKGASKGSARDIQYLKKNFKFSDDLIRGVSTEYSKHKGYIDGWNQDVRLDVMQKIQYEADNLAHVIRAGEAPAFMEHNTIGKVMFPFLQYAFAMQEKMLRNTFHRDGGTAVAMIAAVQFPTAAMLGAVNNVKNGKEWDYNLAASAANSFSIIGAFGIPMSMILSGYGAGSSSAMIPVDTAMKLGAKIFNEDSEATGRDILRATPLNTFLPFPLILSAFEDD